MFCFYSIIKNVNLVYVVRKQCNNKVFFIQLLVSLGHLLIKLLGVNLTPLVYDAAFFY